MDYGSAIFLHSFSSCAACLRASIVSAPTAHAARAAMPPRREKHDELAPSQLIELHCVIPQVQGRIAEYRFRGGQSAVTLLCNSARHQGCRTSLAHTERGEGAASL